VVLTEEDIQQGLETGYMDRLSYKNGWGRSKTVRIRGDKVQGTIKLFRIAAPLVSYGQTGTTLLRRADDLECISISDLIVDSTRD